MRAGMMAMVIPLAVLSQGAVPAGPSRERPSEPVLVLGTFAGYKPGQVAVTYDPKLVPAGAAVAVAHVPPGEGAGTGSVQLRVQGLQPGRKYGAHVHTNACGAKGEDAGPHYQHMRDPVTPSVDPKYANPRNEIWLDLATDAQGNGASRAVMEQGFRDRHPHSVVIHAEHTHTGPGHAGQAGPRLACVNVDF
ncbi:hypothetical protein Sme01_26450 [Sphaerisporangium melleum]|uniref:Superoxide dismutase copper/zinc binding domain-containing protein n=1 Tax=Sphaerisporangium melleum TaxID=321316 RepID=A0A917QWF8_9ACTN|nr:hypothetical protein GCM10007964_12890 [Sphaerisporangium melleum]GII70169.1 hypothetical protein Sme01_26450 [Sphaerisporangium melleum]